MIHIGSQVRMSAAWRADHVAPTALPKGDRGSWYSGYGPMWLWFTGRVERVYEREINTCPNNCSRCAALPQTEQTAVVVHEPVDCGCTPYRGAVCGRCDNTFIATRSYIRVEHLENDDRQ